MLENEASAGIRSSGLCTVPLEAPFILIVQLWGVYLCAYLNYTSTSILRLILTLIRREEVIYCLALLRRAESRLVSASKPCLHPRFCLFVV